jgi:hypothetical protein
MKCSAPAQSFWFVTRWVRGTCTTLPGQRNSHVCCGADVHCTVEQNREVEAAASTNLGDPHFPFLPIIKGAQPNVRNLPKVAGERFQFPPSVLLSPKSHWLFQPEVLIGIQTKDYGSCSAPFAVSRFSIQKIHA